MIGYYNYTTWLTYLGAASGVSGIFFAFSGHPAIAVLCLLFCGLCDMFDGKVASTKKDRTDEQKKFGIQIDSLSDVICFGVLPASIGYDFIKDDLASGKLWLAIPLVLLPVAALARLAYFNVAEETRQKTEGGARRHYNGLPVTTAAGTIPLVYCLRWLINNDGVFKFIYLGCVVAMGTLFLIRSIKIKKPGMKALIVFLILGIILAAFILVMFIRK